MAQLLIVEEFTFVAQTRVHFEEANNYRLMMSLINTCAVSPCLRIFSASTSSLRQELSFFFSRDSFYILYLSRSIALRHDFSLLGCISTYSRALRRNQKQQYQSPWCTSYLIFNFFFRWKVSFNINLRWAIKNTLRNDFLQILSYIKLHCIRDLKNESTRTIYCSLCPNQTYS